MKSLGRLLIALAFIFAVTNSLRAEFIDADSTVAVGIRLKFPIKNDGTSADVDSAWLIVNRWGGTIDTAHYFRAWVNSTDLDTSAGISKSSWRGTPTSLQRRYNLMVKAGEMLQIDATPNPDTAYQGRYSGTFNAFSGGYPTETLFDFIWLRGGSSKTWPQAIARADSLGHGATHAIISHIKDTTGTITTATFAAGAINDAATAADMETAIGLAGWNTAFGTSFTAGSMGDSLTNTSFVGALDFAHVLNPTTTVGLTGTTISSSQVVASVSGAVGSVTGAVGSVTNKVSADLRSIALSSDSATTMANLNEILDADTNSAGNIERVAKVLNVTDSALVDGTSLNGTTNAIGATTIAANAIGSAEIASGAIDVTALAAGAITTSSIAEGAIYDLTIADGAIDAGTFTLGAVDKIAYAVWHMTNDTAGVRWTSGADSSFAEVIAKILTRVKAIEDSMDEAAATGSSSLPDSIAAFVARMGNYFYNDSAWAATGSACGDGPQADSILVLDTSGADTPVPGVWVGMTDAAGNQWHVNSNGDGYVVFGLAYSTLYAKVGFNVGYQFVSDTQTTQADGSELDTLYGYDIVIGAPASPSMARLYGHIKYADNTPVRNATIKVVPDQSGTAVAGGSTTLLPEPLYSAPSDANGLAYVDVWWSSQVVYPSSDLTYKYNIYVLAPNDEAGGAIQETLVRKRVTIPDSTSYNMVLYLQ